METTEKQRILIYRLGSIGDTVVSLPCLHMIRSRFPAARIALMTNRPIESRAVPMASLLEGTGLIDEYIGYPIRMRRLVDMMELCHAIRSFSPELFIYLVSRPTAKLVLRDYLFFGSAGIKLGVGFPFRHEQRVPRSPVSGNGLWESEASRLARCLTKLGPVELDKLASWDLHISDHERAEADLLLDQRMPYGQIFPSRFIGLSIGTKQLVNDWGNDNWRKVLGTIADRKLGLVLIGAREDRERSQEIAGSWPGTVINLCGRATPRVSAAAMERLAFFFCLDSGPMHLAAAVRTPCVAIFSRNNPPGNWFPFGNRHKVLYPSENRSMVEPDRATNAARELLAENLEAAMARR